MTQTDVTVHLKKGAVAPEFCLPDKNNRDVCLHDFKGSWIVLYFYPRDSTSGCTREALDFSAARDDLEHLNAVVLGVSADSVESHRKFVEKHNLRVRLLSDIEHKILTRYGAWQLKKLYGKEFWGTVRSMVASPFPPSGGHYPGHERPSTRFSPHQLQKNWSCNRITSPVRLPHA
jgi:peroxiredoxin Q/BCP